MTHGRLGLKIAASFHFSFFTIHFSFDLRRPSPNARASFHPAGLGDAAGHETFTKFHEKATWFEAGRQQAERIVVRNRATVTISNFTPHSCKNFWYNIGDLIREEGITLMRGDVLVFVARSDSRHILFEDGEWMI